MRDTSRGDWCQLSGFPVTSSILLIIVPKTRLAGLALFVISKKYEGGGGSISGIWSFLCPTILLLWYAEPCRSFRFAQGSSACMCTISQPKVKIAWLTIGQPGQRYFSCRHFIKVVEAFLLLWSIYC